MTTITSPRATTPNISTPATSSAPSARSSISSDRPLPPQGSTRRNRTALRDYYNLPPPSAAPISTAPDTSPLPPQHEISEFDKADFNAQQYVERLVEDEGLAKIMKVESDLLSDIRGLDGERKALVYDNYSKLIDATETIGRVRELLEVEALTGQKKSETQDAIKQVTEGNKKAAVNGKGKLDDLVAHVVEIATQGRPDIENNNVVHESVAKDANSSKKKQQNTVRWVLATPQRIETALREDRSGDARADWDEVKTLLAHWKGVAGTEELKIQCETLLAG